MKKVLAIILCLFLLVLAGCQTPTGTSANNTNDTKSVLLDLNYSKSNTTEGTTAKENKSTVIVDNSKDNIAIKDLPTKTFKEGDVVKFKKDLAYDPDGSKLTYTFSLPLDKNGEWTTKIGDAGEYIISVTASDGQLESTQKIRLIIDAVNRAPVITNFKDITVNEGDLITFNPTVTDEDGDKVTLKYSGFMTTSEYQTTYSDAGDKTVTLTAKDGKTENTKTISITINNVNRAPKLSPISDLTVTEKDTVKVSASATDPDGDALSIVYGMPLDTNGKWTTKVGDAGVYEIDVTASDGKLQDKETFKVTVKALNNLPVIDVPSTITVSEGDLIEIKPVVSDKDGDSLKITYSGFMKSSTYQTTYTDAGNYKTIVTVSDGKDSVSKDIAIVIENKNRAPVFNDTAYFQ